MTIHVPIKPGTARRLGIRQPYAVLAQRWLAETRTLTAEQVDFIRWVYAGPPWRPLSPYYAWPARLNTGR